MNKIKVVSKVSDPPVLSEVDLIQIQQESERLRKAFIARTASMEVLTANDFKTYIQCAASTTHAEAIKA